MLFVVSLGIGIGLVGALSVVAWAFRKAPDPRARRMAIALRGAITMPHPEEDDA